MALPAIGSYRASRGSGGVIANRQVTNRIDFQCNGIGKGAGSELYGKKTRSAGFVEILKDCYRLGQGQAINFQRRHKTLRIALQIFRRAVGAVQQDDRCCYVDRPGSPSAMRRR